MNIGAIIAATVLVAAVGLFIGIFLGVAGNKFAVEVDEKEVAVREALPGNNCGGCGYPGCDGLAAAIAKGEAPVNGCPVGGEPVIYIIGTVNRTFAARNENVFRIPLKNLLRSGCRPQFRCLKVCRTVYRACSLKHFSLKHCSIGNLAY